MGKVYRAIIYGVVIAVLCFFYEARVAAFFGLENAPATQSNVLITLVVAVAAALWPSRFALIWTGIVLLAIAVSVVSGVGTLRYVAGIAVLTLPMLLPFLASLAANGRSAMYRNRKKTFEVKDGTLHY